MKFMENFEERYEEAQMIVIKEQAASATLLHERMGVGYPVALMLLNLLEKQGVISPAYGDRPREVMVTAPINL